MNLRERLCRADWLHELQVALVVGVSLVAAGVVLVVGLALFGPLSATVPSDHVVPAGAATGLRDGVAVDAEGAIGVSVHDPSAAQTALGLLGTLPAGLLVLAMLALLLRTVRRARRHDPFTAGTVRDLRRLGVLAMAGGWLAWTVETLARLALAGTLTRDGYGGTFSLLAPLTWALVGFGYLAVAELLNRGRAMRAELAEVI